MLEAPGPTGPISEAEVRETVAEFAKQAAGETV
jgi:hypothetical protein